MKGHHKLREVRKRHVACEITSSKTFDSFDKLKHIFYRCLWQYPMSQVEYMARAVSCLFENGTGAFTNSITIGKKKRWLKVPLNSSVISNQIPPIIQIDSPVQADDRAASLLDQR